MSFYITLHNKESIFSTQLNNPIYLNGDYEVSLTDLHLNSNILFKYCTIKIKDIDNDFDLDFDIILKDNSPISDFIKKLNFEMTNTVYYYLYTLLFEKDTKTKMSPQDVFLKIVNLDVFEYFSLKNNKIIFDNIDGFYLLEINGYMKKFFKTDLSKLTKEKGSKNITDDFVTLPKKIRNFNNIYIHTNIIDYQYFGDSKIQLLRTIPFRNNFNEFSFETPYYVSVKDTVINTINIEFRDIFGNIISFDNIFTQNILNLHFRKKN